MHSRRQWVCLASFHVWRERYEVLPVTRSGGMPVLDAAHHAKPTKDVEHGGGTHMPNQQKGAPVLCAVPVPLRAGPYSYLRVRSEWRAPMDELDRSQRPATRRKVGAGLSGDGTLWQ